MEQVTTGVRMSTHQKNGSVMEINPVQAEATRPLILKTVVHIC